MEVIKRLIVLFSLLNILPNSVLALSVLEYGAKGNGTSDDRAAIQQAIDAAISKQESLIIPKGTYLLKGGLLVKGNLKLVGQSGAILKPFGIFKVLTLDRGQIDIRGISIDAQNQVNGSGMTGINIQPYTNVRITSSKLINWSHGSGIRYYASNGEDQGTIVLDDLEISGSSPKSKNISPVRWYAISLEKVFNENNKPNQKKQSPISINDCRISGGYYGINLRGISMSTIANNRITDVMRGISLQRGCNNNILKKNKITQCRSSGILVGYDSDRNRIFKNSIRSSNWIAEALIKININCDYTTISKNKLESSTAGIPGENFINISLMCNNTTISKNILIGRSRKPAISIESSWDNTTKDRDQFGYGKNVSLAELSTGSMKGVIITKNNFRQVRKNREDQALIYISTGSSSSGKEVLELSTNKNKFSTPEKSKDLIQHSRGKSQLNKSKSLD